MCHDVNGEFGSKEEIRFFNFALSDELVKLPIDFTLIFIFT